MYYTQLVYVRSGWEDAFHAFEDHVLPLLADHGGQLVLRWRRTPETVIESSADAPYEVHLITFPTSDHFREYLNDESRKALLHLKDGAVERVLLIEGEALT